MSKIYSVQYRLMEELELDGELTPIFLQDNEVISEDVDEIEEMRIYLQPDYENKLIVIKETQEII